MINSNKRMIGIVKWFNNKHGYGFITICDTENEDIHKEVFVHYTSIRVQTNHDQYRYLVAGEYVEFQLTPANKETHEYQAMDVTGIHGGPMMCERPPTRIPSPKKRMIPDTTHDAEFTVVKRKRPRNNV
jgi:cold shock protein